MAQTFVSYASEDRLWVEELVEALRRRGRDVFFDRELLVGAEWASQLERELANSSCVVVLWSKHSVKSFWVRAEAAEALGRGILLQVAFPDVTMPPLFNNRQAAVLESSSDCASDEFGRLLDAIELKAGGPAHNGLDVPQPSEPVTETSLTLVHSCWRRLDKDREFPGRQVHQIHVILFGHTRALDRVEKVTYRLEGYPEGHLVQESSNRRRNFELKELAWGWSLLRADVRIPQQPEGRSSLLRLYRFINMSESGTRLEPYISVSEGWGGLLPDKSC